MRYSNYPRSCLASSNPSGPSAEKSIQPFMRSQDWTVDTPNTSSDGAYYSYVRQLYGYSTNYWSSAARTTEAMARIHTPSTKSPAFQMHIMPARNFRPLTACRKHTTTSTRVLLLRSRYRLRSAARCQICSSAFITFILRQNSRPRPILNFNLSAIHPQYFSGAYDPCRFSPTPEP